ncbi:hypothetical protein [Legionella cincinnatiensis]|uniref:Uncharacterized protein n=2 Tax=Legionella cincinnatiensis TaxID=28085 RepID=A0A378IJB2_9GAMM|nr:hypothetical protein [Legionella cincinnatiensis]KTC93917.1 hypothetical protein Lcin_0005 [Legionella cincinnatiensis]STX35123.1 Uncharacterised protein [Legionella cincinnatiensis]
MNIVEMMLEIFFITDKMFPKSALPYAHNLNKVLEILEGYYIRGYGDSQKPDATVDIKGECNNRSISTNSNKKFIIAQVLTRTAESLPKCGQYCRYRHELTTY